MKRRTGFVSNSSSSSYVCDICGRNDVGYEGCGDVGMFYCMHGHYVCEEHLPLKSIKQTICNMSVKDFIKIVKTYGSLDDVEGWETLEDGTDDLTYAIEEWFEDTEGYYNEVPEIFCPICQMEQFIGNELAQYLMKEHNVSKEILIKQVKKKFKDYGSFLTYIKDVDL